MRQRHIQTDRLNQHILEAGSGPLVLLVHGFPELAVSWRGQVEALAGAGFRAVAPDMRGYGGTDRPPGTGAYGVLDLVGDMVDLVRALGEARCVVVGHDWGAAVAWHCALTRPDLFTAVAALSVPFQPRRPKGPPTAAMAALRKMFHAYDGATPDDRQSTGFIPEGRNFLSTVPDDAALPPWMGEAHFEDYVAAFAAGGFRGPLDWYRCLDLNWTQTAFLQDARIRVPAAFMVGKRDPVRRYAGAHEAAMKDWIPDLRVQRVLPGAGHWIQQERPDEVNRRLLDFLGQVGG